MWWTQMSGGLWCQNERGKRQNWDMPREDLGHNSSSTATLGLHATHVLDLLYPAAFPLWAQSQLLNSRHPAPPCLGEMPSLMLSAVPGSCPPLYQSAGSCWCAACTVPHCLLCKVCGYGTSSYKALGHEKLINITTSFITIFILHLMFPYMT